MPSELPTNYASAKQATVEEPSILSIGDKPSFTFLHSVKDNRTCLQPRQITLPFETS